MKIVPAILPERYAEIEEGVEKVFGAVSTIQIDFVDGKFAPNKTWWFNGKDKDMLDAFLHEEQGLPHWERIDYEFDLMVDDPLALIDTFTMIGPSKIIFHIETLDNDMVMHFFDTLPEITRQTIRFELAFGVESDVSVILPYMESIDSIQCMGISRVGFQGQAFDPRVIDQIKKLRELYPEKTIAVDGGVNEETIASLARAGVTEFVVGSAIFGNDDPRGTIERLKTRCNAAFTA